MARIPTYYIVSDTTADLVDKLRAERDEARAWARRLLAELHRVTDERDAMRSQLQALAESRYAGEED
jgi:uncharacterized coiled-coil DUF342 family protein